MPLLAGLARDARRAFEPKPGTGYGYPGGGANIMHNLLGARTKSGQHVSDRRALALSAWQRAMEIRSNVPGTLPVHVYQKTSDGRRLRRASKITGTRPTSTMHNAAIDPSS